MDHNFGTLWHVSLQWRELKPIGQFPTIKLWWPTLFLHALALVFEQWSIHVSAGKSRSRVAPLQHRFWVKEHNFGTLRRLSWPRRELKPIDQIPMIDLWWPTPCFHVLTLVFEQWSIHVSAGKSRSQVAPLWRPLVTSCRHLCLHFIFKKIIVSLNV